MRVPFLFYLCSLIKRYYMKVNICTVMGQVYILPYVKVTHSRWLNGDIEFIIGWFNKELIFSI